MQLGTVIGHATSTIKHPSLNGWKLLIVQLLNNARQPELEPVIAIDSLGAGAGTLVVIDTDGKHARELTGNEKSPIRWYTVAIVDELQQQK